MSRVNQQDAPIEETILFQCWGERSTNEERDWAIGSILQHLGMEVVRTNATKHGNVDLVLRSTETPTS